MRSYIDLTFEYDVIKDQNIMVSFPTQLIWRYSGLCQYV